MASKVLLVACALVCAAGANADRVDDYVRREMVGRHIPGCSLALLKNGRVLKVGSYGSSNLELQTKVTNDTVFEIGSVSKQFEAAGLMELSKEGKLNWDAPISSIVPNLPASWPAVTPRQLMSHTSGLPDYTDSKEHDLHAGDEVTHDQVIQSIADSPMMFKPGASWVYCNTGSFLCGMAIEKATGESYDSFMRDTFFHRLGMTSTRLNDNGSIIHERASGYVWQNGTYQRAGFEDPSWPFAGGGMLSTINDMVKWEQDLHRREVAGDPLLEKMWTPVQTTSGAYPYGLGWQLSDDRGLPCIWHTGHIPGFSAVISRFPSNGYTVILLTNKDNLDTNQMAREIMALNDKRFIPPSDLQPPKDPDPARTKHMESALASLANAQPSSDVTPSLSAFVSDVWRAKVKQGIDAGAKLIYLGTDDVRSYNIERLGAKIATECHYRVSLGDISFTEGMYLSADGKLAFVADE